VLDAQQKQLPVIGYLSSNPPNVPVGEVAAFREGLADVGVVEGRDAAIEYRFAEGKYDRLPRFAAELVTRDVDVIAASGLPAALAAKSATAKIPIVFTVGVDPVAQGLVESLSRPGGNLTGVTQLVGPLAAKQLELLHEIAPNASVIGFLTNPTNPNAAALNKVVSAAAETLGVRIIPLSAVDHDGIEIAFTAGREKGMGALLFSGDAFFRTQARWLIEMASRYRIATMFDEREYYVAEGALISYGVRRSDMRRQAGVYSGRILKGAKPGDLPVMQPTKFELLVNLKTAKMLGLTIPPALLARADEVIE
jgi:putative ABC transport system substrate-binding protein